MNTAMLFICEYRCEKTVRLRREALYHSEGHADLSYTDDLIDVVVSVFPAF